MATRKSPHIPSSSPLSSPEHEPTTPPRKKRRKSTQPSKHSSDLPILFSSDDDVNTHSSRRLKKRRVSPSLSPTRSNDIDVVNDDSNTTPRPSQPSQPSTPSAPRHEAQDDTDQPLPAPGNSLKLPRIPKKKQAGLAGTSNPASSAGTPSRTPTAKPSQPLPKPVAAKIPPPVGAIKRNPVPGTNDVDLRDASVYSKLFGVHKGPTTSKLGPATPRPNISVSAHREKGAARRAELHRLRDEDRARRMKDNTTASFLYEQHNRITKFEERLQARDSPALLGPNVLAGAFRTWGKKIATTANT